MPWDSSEGVAILDEWQRIRRGTSLDERQHIRRETPVRRPVRTRGLAQPSTDGTIQPLRAATAPLSSSSPPSQNPPLQGPDRPSTPIGDTIFVRYQVMPPFLKIISANVQRSIANTDGVLELAVKRKCQIACIQEPPITFGKVRRHPSFTTLALDDNDTRAAIYVNRHLTFDPAFPSTTPFSASPYHRSRLSTYTCIPGWIGPSQTGHALETYNAYSALLSLATLIHDTTLGFPSPAEPQKRHARCLDLDPWPSRPKPARLYTSGWWSTRSSPGAGDSLR